LAFSIPIKFLETVALYALLAMNQRFKILLSSLSSAVINIGLNIILIPRFSFNGAALVVFISHVFLLFMLFQYLYRYEKLFLSFKIFPTVALVNIIFAIMVVILKPIRIYYSIPLAILTYSILIYLSKCVNFQDLFLMLRVNTKNNNE
jgi:O-antigen/teichoic acid export membrane protein